MEALKLQENYYPLPIDKKGVNNKNTKVVRRYRVRKKIVATDKTRRMLLDFVFCGFGLLIFSIFVFGFLYLGADCVNYI